MISLIIALILVWAFYIGYARGIFLQAYYSLTSLLGLFVANLFYRQVAQALTLWVPYSNPSQDAQVRFFTNRDIFSLDDVFYAGVAFFLLYLSVYLTGRILGLFVHLFKVDSLTSAFRNILAGGLSVLVTLLGISMVLTILATVPLTSLQERLYSSGFVRVLVNLVPLFSTWWS
ncbi:MULTISPECIES: CvpA family protein [unclassified Streptococcus]|uniref:CvpA family protein n=1 Tax=unclassified Streptococcus TaxID=2608887 RepID=UPI0011B3F575|nr:MULTISPECIES: CvpA family protein [unclassified Streptococcus]TWS94775.1 CvpA family protein [Streptococcus sp. sy018]TWT11341.1 CvpA family protein [Streptococcus sp. sy004]